MQARHLHRPEVLILRLVQLVKTHSEVGRIELQIEGAFCSSPVRWARLSVNVSEMVKSITSVSFPATASP